jgi:hypothetical protein
VKKLYSSIFFNFDVVFFIHLKSVFILSLKKDLSSFYNLKFYQTVIIV